MVAGHSPVLLAAGGVLYWGTRSSSKFGIIVGTFLLAIPFLFMANNKISSWRENARYQAQKAADGQFADATLNNIAKAVDADDTTLVRTLLTANKSLNLTERDAAGHTLQGFFATRASDYEATDAKIVALRLLFESGVTYAPDALQEGGDWNRDLVENAPDKRDEVIALALVAGANANARSRNGTENMLLNSNVHVPRAKLLVQHGADVHVLTNGGHNVVMNAIRFHAFPLALHYLSIGIDPNYTSPSGNSALTELARVNAENESYQKPKEEGYDELLAALKAAVAK